MTERENTLRRRIRWLVALFIFGLVVSGATAIPLTTEVKWLAEMMPGPGPSPNALQVWILKIHDALQMVAGTYPFLAYGTDWLAFGHFVFALAFVGAWRDPARNIWLFDFGLIACALIIPYALIFGAVRGIPLGWRLLDCCFGVFGAMPLIWARKYARELEAAHSMKLWSF
jgi:hypothetical protein